MATGAGLWDAGLRAWYGPGTPLVQRVRSYRPNRRGHIKLARWARIGCIRVAAVLLAVIALAVTLDPPPASDTGERGLVGTLGPVVKLPSAGRRLGTHARCVAEMAK